MLATVLGISRAKALVDKLWPVLISTFYVVRFNNYHLLLQKIEAVFKNLGFSIRCVSTMFKRNFEPKQVKDHRVVGLARNSFGTRLCQRVECKKCQKVDYVSIRVSAEKDQFCRDCAEKILGAFDPGRHIEEKKAPRICEQCNKDFFINESTANKKDQLLCIDCYRGFEIWRGRMGETSKLERLLVKTGTKTTIRKNSNGAI